MDKLVGFIKSLPPPAVAFSGGVDSSLVAAAALRAHGEKALAVTVHSELVPDSEVAQASDVARAMGIRHEVVRLSVLDNEDVVSNPPDRCYHCKKDDFAAIRKLAVRDGLGSVLDGTNADDMLGHRPGIRALREMGIVSPLMELGYTKARVRELARGMGLANHDRPSSPCMASRFPYGVRLSTEGVERVRQAEEFIRSLGVKVLRVRDHAGIARIEVEPEVMPTLVSGGVAEKIVERLKSLGYNYVSLDLQGFRSGSLDEPLGKG